jgi:predicted acylesterase/phospholipase RssA/CRP-like cAMP-binding protein
MSNLYPLSSRPELNTGRLRAAMETYFGKMDDKTYERLSKLVEWIELPANRILVRQGEEGDSMYILISGRLQAIIEDQEGNRSVVGEVGKGESVGEMALFTGDPRSADIFSIRDSLLVKISKATFDELVKAFPPSAVNISRLIINRFQNRLTPQISKSSVVNISLIPLNARVPIKLFAEKLFTELTKHGKVLLLHEENVSSLSGISHAPKVTEGDASHAQLTSWLDEQENTYEYVIYLAGSEFSPWTRRCLRQADRLLLVGNFEDAAEPGQVENKWLKEEVPESASYQELVLIHRYTEGLPSYSRRWLRLRKVDRHYHVRWENNGDIARLARYLSGNALGLVFGGGGARGFAHLGVYQALKEAGVEVDCFGGASSGAIFAAAMAMDMDYAPILAKGKKFFTRQNPIGDFNWYPMISLSKGKRMDKLLQINFGEQDIEDLWKGFFCVSSNLNTAELKVWKRGSLWKSIRAGLAIPGVMPPVVEGNQVYVDGGVLNNLPVDVMRKQGMGKIIAVDLEVNRRFTLPYTEMPSTWDVIKSRWQPGKEKLSVPRLTSTIWKSIVLNSSSEKSQKQNMADWYLNPPVQHIGLLKWKQFDEALKTGYAYAQKQMEAAPDFIQAFREKE